MEFYKVPEKELKDAILHPIATDVLIEDKNIGIVIGKLIKKSVGRKSFTVREYGSGREFKLHYGDIQQLFVVKDFNNNAQDLVLFRDSGVTLHTPMEEKSSLLKGLAKSRVLIQDTYRKDYPIYGLFLNTKNSKRYEVFELNPKKEEPDREELLGISASDKEKIIISSRNSLKGQSLERSLSSLNRLFIEERYQVVRQPNQHSQP